MPNTAHPEHAIRCPWCQAPTCHRPYALRRPDGSADPSQDCPGSRQKPTR